jgi:hypothetical protein
MDVNGAAWFLGRRGWTDRDQLGPTGTDWDGPGQTGTHCVLSRNSSHLGLGGVSFAHQGGVKPD